MAYDEYLRNWTEYEQLKREVEDGTKRMLLTKLDALIHECEENGTAKDFIHGLQRARKIISPEPNPLNQTRLF